MLKLACIGISLAFGLVKALPTSPVLGSSEPGIRYQHASDSREDVQLVDLWANLNDVSEAARFDPVSTNAYHLFTRSNPSVSQPILLNNAAHLANTNFDSSRRTVVLIHGWRETALSELTTVIVPTYLAADDVNIIVVDWGAGASSLSYRVVIANTISSGAAVANFITWLNQASGSNLEQYHIIGHGFGGHQAGIVGRNLHGDVAYITALNPALIGWTTNIYKFQPTDGRYTEVIITNYLVGYLEPLGHVGFYPNGGISMPGCDSNECDDAMSYFYLAESITSGGFAARQCLNAYTAVLSLCNSLPGTLQMGGLRPKTGSRGVYWLETNASPPFSQG